MKKTLALVSLLVISQQITAEPKLYRGMTVDELNEQLGVPPHSGDGNLRDRRTALLKYCSTRNGKHTLVYFLIRDRKLLGAKKTSNRNGGQCHDHFQYADFEAIEETNQIVLTDRLLPMTSSQETPKQQEKHWSQKFAEAAGRFNQSMQKSYQNHNTEEIMNNFTRGLRETTKEMNRSDKIRCRKSYGAYDYECKQGGIFD